MAENVYDCMLILDSNRYAREAAAIADQIKQIIESQGGEVLVSRLWEERRLAYPIRGHRKGTYWLTYFRLESRNVHKVEREFELNENIIRSLVLKVDARIADALVKHASTARTGESRPSRSHDGAGAERPAVEPAAQEEVSGVH